ncbi:hypothetical protein DES47_1069 [Roseateles toxinivorans]|uniref:Uncharacterized protein n=1 Tax=Roseateles toxinivorans TaxID=270368 RepID=A0A4R6QIA3_9BURK|nr:hypothetical protein DES47_1069 [Roseateles toxinivorans]
MPGKPGGAQEMGAGRPVSRGAEGREGAEAQRAVSATRSTRTWPLLSAALTARAYC